MQLRHLIEILADCDIRYEIYSPNCDNVIASDDTLHDAIVFGIDVYMHYRVKFMAIVNTEKQPETLQIYL